MRKSIAHKGGVREGGMREDGMREGGVRKGGVREGGVHEDALRSCLLVFACFTLTSESWIGWLYHLMEQAPAQSADGLTMVGGYLCQAAGIAIAALICKRRPSFAQFGTFAGAIGLHLVCATLALWAPDFAGTLVWGYLMSIFCGIIAAFYLMRLARCTPPRRFGIVFGGGYGCSIVATWLLSLVQGPFDLAFGLPVYVLLSALSLLVAWEKADRNSTDDDLARVAVPTQKAPKRATAPSPNGGRMAQKSASVDPAGAMEPASTMGSIGTVSWRLVAIGCAAVVLMSFVKNLGFGFPSADLGEGVSVEFSRLFYAAGLVIAGLVTDWNRRYGALCCMAALVTPFALMALAGEPVSSLVLWAVDYFFYGFFSVFRIVLFADMAARENSLFLASFGLMAGRVGDALGVAVRLACGASIIALVVVAALAFMAAIVALYAAVQQLYGSGQQHDSPGQQQDNPDWQQSNPGQLQDSPGQQENPKPAGTEQIAGTTLAFERFSARYELSAREREVMRALLDDKTNAEIAAELFVQEGTVKFHVRNLLKKTSCTNRKELRARYFEELETPHA